MHLKLYPEGMKLYEKRERSLPTGWYPDTEEGVREILMKWGDMHGKREENCISGIVPHAGWFFSGYIAFSVMSNLITDAETVVIAGGHLPRGISAMLFNYRELDTPLGPLETDLTFLEELSESIKFYEGTEADNTVEVQLPIIKYLFPESKVVALRVGAGDDSIELGKEIAAVSRNLGKKTVVVGSTDLTHYGPSYGFTPHGTGNSALRWVKEVNDKKIIDAFISMDGERVLEHGNRDKAACSSGAAACAIAFAREKGRTRGELISYKTSNDVYQGDSFVGYAGVVY